MIFVTGDIYRGNLYAIKNLWVQAKKINTMTKTINYNNYDRN